MVQVTPQDSPRAEAEGALVLNPEPTFASAFPFPALPSSFPGRLFREHLVNSMHEHAYPRLCFWGTRPQNLFYSHFAVEEVKALISKKEEPDHGPLLHPQKDFSKGTREQQVKGSCQRERDERERRGMRMWGLEV